MYGTHNVVIFDKSQNMLAVEVIRETTFTFDPLLCRHKHSQIINNMIKSCKDKVSVEY